MNPLDLRGPDFLRLYALLAAAAVPAGFGLRRFVEGFASTTMGASSLTAYEAAYLRGGSSAVGEATLATLIRRGAMTADDRTDELVLEPSPGGMFSKSSLEYEFLASLDREASLPAAVMRDRAAAIAARVVESLERRQLAFSAERRRLLGVAFCLPMVAVTALGVAKIAVGLARDRPVSILGVFCIATAIAAVAMFSRRPIGTPAGRDSLRRARAENEALRETASRRTASLAPDDVAMAVGLFGLAAVADSSMDALRRQLRPPQTAGGSTSGCGSCSSCGSSSSGSSCASGCGGGGGCGGCGS